MVKVKMSCLAIRAARIEIPTPTHLLTVFHYYPLKEFMNLIKMYCEKYSIYRMFMAAIVEVQNNRMNFLWEIYFIFMQISPVVWLIQHSRH